MLKIIAKKWDENKDKLRSILAERTDLNSVDYIDLVKLSFETIYNYGLDDYKTEHYVGYGDLISLDLDKIHIIDDGDYQGTLLYIIPFNTYQPCEFEYLMTYVGYGSCSGCDALESIQAWDEKKLTDRQVEDFMRLCKDILTNTIKPYNGGWRQTEAFEQIEEAN